MAELDWFERHSQCMDGMEWMAWLLTHFTFLLVSSGDGLYELIFCLVWLAGVYSAGSFLFCSYSSFFPRPFDGSTSSNYCYSSGKSRRWVPRGC